MSVLRILHPVLQKVQSAEAILRHCWNCHGIKASKDNKDLANAEKILDEDHYGLEKVKRAYAGILSSPESDS